MTKSLHGGRKRGVFITLEGPDGSGKSTQVSLLTEHLRARGIEPVVTREPGGTRTGELIREILQHDRTEEPLAPETETFLFLAARAQLVRAVIRPALVEGRWVLCDRFMDSTVAYQGYGRGLGPDLIEPMNALAVGETVPDLTILLDLDPAIGLERIGHRNRAIGRQADRLERETLAFHERLREGYLALAARFPERIRLVDARPEPREVFLRIWSLLEERFGNALG
mgnify:FL=1